MSSLRVAYVSTITLAICVLLLVALAIGGTHPAVTGGLTGHATGATSAAQSRYLSYSFLTGREGSASPNNPVPLIVTLALIAIAASFVILIARRMLRHGFDKSSFLTLLGLVAAAVLAFELISAHYDSASLSTKSLPRGSTCEVRGATIEVFADGCSFEANGPSSWTLNDDLLPTDLEFETAAGENTIPTANSDQPQFAVGVWNCPKMDCSGRELSFAVSLGISTKQDRARDFTRTTTFVDTAPGRSEWFVGILTYLPHEKGTTSHTPALKTRHGFDWRAFIEALSGTILLGVLLVLVGPTVIRRLRRRRGGSGDDNDGPDNSIARVESDPDQLLVAADEILGEETDPRAAILRCWLELERFLDALGLARERSETADELTARLMQLDPTVRRELVELHALFISARFSTRPVGESERDAARALLKQLRASFAKANILVAQAST